VDGVLLVSTTDAEIDTNGLLLAYNASSGQTVWNFAAFDGAYIAGIMGK
jgi:outer membrane protein assembly factor BamB